MHADLTALFDWMRKNPTWAREINAIDHLVAERDALRKLLDQVTEKWLEDANPDECPDLCASVRAAMLDKVEER
jgi:hypothetical protein